MMDSGICIGFDIVSILVFGVEFVFFGCFFMYGVVVLGKEGGNYMIFILKK